MKKAKTYLLNKASIYAREVDLEKAKEILANPELTKEYVESLEEPYGKGKKRLFPLINDVFLEAAKEIKDNIFFDEVFKMLKSKSNYCKKEYIESFIALAWEGGGVDIYNKHIGSVNREPWISAILLDINKSGLIFDELSYNQESALDYLINTEKEEDIINGKYSYKVNKNGKRVELKLDLKTRYAIEVYTSAHQKRVKKINFMNLLKTKYNLSFDYPLLVDVLKRLGLDYYKLNFINDKNLNETVIDYCLIGKGNENKISTTILEASKYSYMKKQMNAIFYNNLSYDLDSKSYSGVKEAEDLFLSFKKDKFLRENMALFFKDKGDKAKSAEIKAKCLYFALSLTIDEGKNKEKGKVSKI